MRGRYAPSPTGLLHLGNARTALMAWLSARAAGGEFVMRIEDLDRPRIAAGAEFALIEDLKWLGLDWDEGPDVGGPFAPYRQSEREHLYTAAIERLLVTGHAYLCACSRADVMRAASAPHSEDDEGPRYPGTCRALARDEVEARARERGRPPVVRFHGEGRRISFADEVHGVVEPMGEAGVDDFVLRRADGVAAYQLAVMVDDAAMDIDDVVRGDDLLTSTPRQIALREALGHAVRPRFAHVPLVLSSGGERMAKRRRPMTLAEIRTAGTSSEVVVGRLAASAGLLAAPEAVRPKDLVPEFAWSRLRREPAVWDG